MYKVKGHMYKEAWTVLPHEHQYPSIHMLTIDSTSLLRCRGNDQTNLGHLVFASEFANALQTMSNIVGLLLLEMTSTSTHLDEFPEHALYSVKEYQIPP